MIFGILEFCINTINGPFSHTADCIVDCFGSWVGIPAVCAAYVALFGQKTPLLSFIIIQNLLLFNIFHRMHQQVEWLLRSHMRKSLLYYFINFLAGNILTVSLVSILFIHFVYQIQFRRTISISGRLSHALCISTAGLIFGEGMSLCISGFIMNKTLNACLTRVLVHHSELFTACLMSFVGVYYFITLGKRTPVLQYCIPDSLTFRPRYDGVGWNVRWLILSYSLFVSLLTLCVSWNLRRMKKTPYASK